MKINEIYLSYMGEQNCWGIGEPAIFVRKQGCHLRCYKSTLGILCDTPNSLELDTLRSHQTVSEIVKSIEAIWVDSGCNLICFTGGEPLFGDKSEIKQFLSALLIRGFRIVVETSGTISLMPYKKSLEEDYPDLSKSLSFVIDYKGISTGIAKELNIVLKKEELNLLNSKDYIKFVLYDENDLSEMMDLLPSLRKCAAKVVAGIYWGGKLPITKLFSTLKNAGVLDIVAINFQTHKLVLSQEIRPASEEETLIINQTQI